MRLLFTAGILTAKAESLTYDSPAWARLVSNQPGKFAPMRAAAIAITAMALAALGAAPAGGETTSGGKQVPVSIHCIGSLDGIYVYGRPLVGAGCSGTLTLRLRGRAVGSSGFALANNQAVTLRVVLATKARKVLRRAGSIRVKVVLVTRGSVSAAELLEVRLKRKRGKRRSR